MEEKDYKIAKELKERLAEIIPLIDFKIFGSRAKGKSGEYSDMDVFVEVETINKEIESQIYDISWEVGYENYVFISPLIFTRDEIENSPLKASAIVDNIKREGISI